MLRTFVRRLFLRRKAMLDVGKEAPDFSVSDHQGQAVTKEGLLGKRFVLWFYPKADTPG